MGVRRQPVTSLALLGLVLVLPGGALAEGFGGSIEPSVNASRSTSTDQSGRSTFVTSEAFLQKYRLNVDRSVYPLLRFFGNGILEKEDGSMGELQAIDRTLTNLNLMVTAGNKVLNASLQGSRREEAGRSTLGTRNVVNESAGLVVGWRPLELPIAELRLMHSRNYDTRRVELDTTLRDATLSVRYESREKVRVSDTIRFSNVRDFLTDSNTSELANSFHASQDGVILKGRTRFHASLSLDNRYTRAEVMAAGAELSTQRFPVFGLSLVEAFPALPTADTLVRNPAVIDGNTTASASINIGFSPSAAGDTNPRDVGAEFADAVTEVNRLFVFVDRALSELVANSFIWDVYQSADNVSWTPVPLAGGVSFNRFQNRFEIPIALTQAPFLKVVTRPLPASVTSEPAFSDIFITELQFFHVVAAPEEVVTNSGATQRLDFSARSRIFSNPGLHHDLTANFGHTSGLHEHFIYFVSNGLSTDYLWKRKYRLNARISRQDYDQGNGHEGAFLYGGSASTSLLPTVRQGLTFSGKMGGNAAGPTNNNGVTFYNSAELYRGIGAQAVFGYSVGRVADVTNSSAQMNLSTSIAPYRPLSLGGSYSYVNSHLWRGNVRTVSVDSRLTGSVAYTPVTAFSVSGSIMRMMPSQARARTLASYGVGFAPFPGGELQLSMSYSESFDAGTQSVVRSVAPSLRWSIRSGTWVQVDYSYTSSDYEVNRSSNHFFSALLMVTL